MESLISRVILVILWLCLPILLLLNAPIKFIVFVTVIWLFALYSHICMALVHRDLLVNAKPWPGIARILLFGPIEIEHLKKLQQVTLNTP